MMNVYRRTTNLKQDSVLSGAPSVEQLAQLNAKILGLWR
jgi:hypothetical protein